MAALVALWDKVDSRVLVGQLNKWSQDVLGFALPQRLSMYSGTSHWPFLAVSVAIYLLVIFSLERFMRSKKDLKTSKAFNQFSFVHNVVMSLFSLYMFIDAAVKVYQHGGLRSFHDYMSVGITPQFYAIHDLFYWSKFLELIDTVILVLRKKDLGFLHVFHHCTTAAVSYSSRYQPLWMGTWTNGLVHVCMYAHFARPIEFIRPHLTSMQIVQFIFVLTTYNYWWMNYTNLPWLDVALGDFCYLVYLAFFCKFFYENYISKKEKGARVPPKGKEARVPPKEKKEK